MGTVIVTRGSGATTRPMGVVYSPMRMAQCTMERYCDIYLKWSGGTINNMATGRRVGWMVVVTRATTGRGRSTGKGYYSSQMVVITRVSSEVIRLRAMGSTPGLMVGSTLVSGYRIK